MLPFRTEPGSPPLHTQITMCLQPGMSIVFPDTVPKQAADLLSKLLCPPVSRLSAAKVRPALAHAGAPTPPRSPVATRRRWPTRG